MIGRTLSHYKVLKELSRGGMGIVYRALDLKLDREVALKDGVTFIAIELIEGEKLRDIINKEKLPLARSLELATEVADKCRPGCAWLNPIMA